jgi:hypothetical protein
MEREGSKTSDSSRSRGRESSSELERARAGSQKRNLLLVTGQNEREESTQNTAVTKSAACASYKIKATT